MEIRPILSTLLRNKTAALLVALQVALSLAILANILHIVSERRSSAARPSGIADEHAVFAIEVSHLSNDGPQQQLARKKHEVELLRAVPGVAGVAEVSQVPLSESGWNSSVTIAPDQEQESAIASTYYAADSLIRTWGLKLIEGRDFLPTEIQDIDINSTDKPQVAIITRALANKLWPGQSALGKAIYSGSGSGMITVHVIGVVERLQTAHAPVGDNAELSTISPVRLYGSNRPTLYTVRAAAGQRENVIREVEAALRRASATPLVLETRTVDKMRASRYRADLALSWMLITVSVLLLLITASGIVGMASLWVTQRRKQIGVRRALGARKRDILRYFLLENLMITSFGVGTGVLLGVALNQLLVSKLEMARLPLAYLGAGALLLWALGLLAVYGPAWRAANTSPALATRST